MTSRRVRRPACSPAVFGLALVVVLVLLAWLMPGRGSRTLRHVVTSVGAIALMTLFVLGRQAAARASLKPVAWWGWGVAAVVAASFVPAFHSSDIHAYTQVGWLQTHYDANPYVTRPADVAGGAADEMFTDTWRDTPCVYGPLFAWITRGPAALSHGAPQVAHRWLRLLNALCVLLIAWLLWRSAPSKRARVRVLYAWLWSPFVLLHLVANAHNDGVFGLWLLLGMLAARRGAVVWVVPLITLAALTKIVAIVALPFAAVWTWKRAGPKPAGIALGISAILVAAACVPYAAAWESIRFDLIWREWTKPAHSLLASVSGMVRALESLWGGHGATADVVSTGVRGLLLGGYAAWWLVSLARASRAPTYDATRLLTHTVAALGILLVLVSAKFYPWYLCMVLPAALLLPAVHPLRRAGVLLSVTWMLTFTGLGKARIIDYVVMTALPLWCFISRERTRTSSGADATPGST